MEQQDLFERASNPLVEVSGFRLEENYIAKEEERELLARIDREPWQTDYRRRIQQYGLGYGSSQSDGPPTWLRDFPEWLRPLAAKVHRDAPFERFPENCVINEYIPPLGIGAHKDYPAFGPTVACVSLGSDIVMDLGNPEDGIRMAVYVPARSLWVITGDARWKWTHGIAARLSDKVEGERRPRSRRVSITFRTGKV